MTIGAFANYEYNHPRYVEGMYMFEEYMSVSIGDMVETCKLAAPAAMKRGYTNSQAFKWSTATLVRGQTALSMFRRAFGSRSGCGDAAICKGCSQKLLSVALLATLNHLVQWKLPTPLVFGQKKLEPERPRRTTLSKKRHTGHLVSVASP